MLLPLGLLIPSYALVLVTPGPNLLIVLRASLSGSARSVSAAALGIGCGAGLAAIGALLAASALGSGVTTGMTGIEIGGRLLFAALLARAGWRTLRRVGARRETVAINPQSELVGHFRVGLLTALSNPLTLPFFAGYFLSHPETQDPRVALSACALVVAMAIGWFGGLGWLLARRAWRDFYGRAGYWPDLTVGGALLVCACLAVWPVFSSSYHTPGVVG
ncbi:LysE family transporter (plasmid) [Roseomonas sp. CCTCC AB2023176]|uniref:LysE family transporter n=1 Tax=Roseomonas sp. CCTCC AB2023176 TaxID=3342640 RepID=UPI0035DF6368